MSKEKTFDVSKSKNNIAVDDFVSVQIDEKS